MKIPLPYYNVELEDGREWLCVRPDQRDMRRAELSLGLDMERDRNGWMRGQCWAALVRLGELDGMTWRDFDTVCVAAFPDIADDTAEAEAEAEVVAELDPTGTAGDGS